MDAEKLSKRDTVKRKERGGDARTHARTHVCTRAHEREEKEEIKGGNGEDVYEAGDREKEEKMEREKRGRGKKAWCNGGTSLRVSAPHQREALQPLDARTMPPGKEGRGRETLRIP